MNIKTKDFLTTKKELFNVLLINSLKQYWWLLAGLLIMGILHLAERNYAGLLGDILILFIWIFIVWSTVNSKKNAIFLKKRYLEIGDSFVSIYTENGTSSKINFNDFRKVVKTDKYYLLFISKSQFIYLPKSSLLVEEIQTFDFLLKNKKLI